MLIDMLMILLVAFILYRVIPRQMTSQRIAEQ